MSETKFCSRCGSEKIVKRGKALNAMKTTWKQRFYCKKCGFKFIDKKPNLCDDYEAPKFEYKSKEIEPIDWSSYNEAQLNEKPMFLKILNDVLEMFVFEQVKSNGRPVFNSKDLLFGMLVKIYNKNSARRTISDLKLMKELGYIEQIPCYVTLMNHFNNPSFKPILEKMIELTALPLKDVESDFAADSTGFSTSQFGRWFDEKWGEEKEKRIYRKAHVMTGVLTNVVTSCIVTKQEGKGTGDTTQFKPLLNKTAINFKLKEVSADMAYLSRENLEAVIKKGALPFIPFKSNVTGAGNGLIWRTLWKFFKDNPQDFYECYHKRSNVESTFNMIKQKFNGFLMTRIYMANTNEILCKVIAHNICRLISAYFELKLKTTILTEAQETAKISILL
ncbi:Transposase DDE domain protein [uncultured archaeon]|nr:Transposase DDE domain protein [uncultured archaeon]